MTQHVPRRRTARAAVAALGLALLLAGCAADSPNPSTGGKTSSPHRGGNVTMTLPSDPGTLDLQVSPLQTTTFMGDEVFESLFALNARYQAEPMLVDKWSASEDRLTYTFKLRSGITFQNGDPLEADDVVASLKRFLAVSGTGLQMAPSVSSIVATDSSTVVLTLKTPRYSLISELASAPAAIMPASIASTAGADALAPKDAIGTGPYEVAAYTPGQSIELKRFDKYESRKEENWGGTAGAKHAYLDTITYKFVSEDSTLVNGLTTGQWQLSNPSADEYQTLKANPDLVVKPASGAFINTIVLNHNPESVFSNLLARQALNLLTDKKQFAAAAGTSGQLLIKSGAFQAPENTPLYSTAGNATYSAHDVQKAKELFAQAGVKSIRMLVSSDFPQFVAWGTVLQNELSKIGIKVEVQTLDNTAVRALATSKPESWDLFFTYVSGVLSTPGQVNWLQPTYPNKYQSDTLDALLADYAAAQNADQAKAAATKVQAFVWQDLPSIVLYGSKSYSAYSKHLHGFDNFSDLLYNSWLD